MAALRTLCGAGNDHANYALGVAISLELNIPNFRTKSLWMILLIYYVKNLERFYGFTDGVVK